jgi:ankyrin repeat protein
MNSGIKNDEADDEEVLTPLHLAAIEGQIEDMGVLLSNGADVNIKTNKGMAPLHSAVIGKQPEAVNFLLKYGADVNAPNAIGGTPIFYAVLKDRIDLAETLLAHGASLNAKDKRGGTPFDIAIESEERDGRSVCIKLLKRRHEPYEEGRKNAPAIGRYARPRGLPQQPGASSPRSGRSQESDVLIQASRSGLPKMPLRRSPGGIV